MKKIKNLFSAINTKITVLFLLLFIPLFLAGFSIYKYGYTSVKQEITDSSTSQLSLYAHSLSDEITRIQLSCYQLASNEDINYLAKHIASWVNMNVLNIFFEPHNFFPYCKTAAVSSKVLPFTSLQ